MSLKVKYYKAGNDLDWLVKQFETIYFKGNDVILDKFIPREDASIVFHLKGCPQLVKPTDQCLPPFFIAPLSPNANLIRIDKEMDTFIVSCKPTVLSGILNISLVPGSQTYIPLPYDIFFPLWEKLSHLKSAEQRIKYFYRFADNIMQSTYIPDETDIFYDTIVKNGLRVPLREIINSFPVDERTVQRKLRKRLGVSPKTLIRIVRFNYLWEKINSNNIIDYQDLVYYGNYFDQTHLIKDFKAITGETPDYFFKRNLRVVKIFSGK